jgi:hypothetical protein
VADRNRQQTSSARNTTTDKPPQLTEREIDSMNTWLGQRLIPVVTACMRPDGLPTFVQHQVKVTDDEYADGVHLLQVEEQLGREGYEEPFVHFAGDEAPAFLVEAVKHYLALALALPEPITEVYPEER